MTAKPTAFDELRYGYFDMAFNNILKSIRGGVNPIGTTTLGMCAVGALSEIEWSINNQQKLETTGELKAMTKKERDTLGYYDKQMFEGWLNRWVRDSGINTSCDASRVYGLRCALVHTGGGSEALSKTGVKAWYITATDSADHYTVQQSTVLRFNLYMPDFLAELILAADQFLIDQKTVLDNASPELRLWIGSLCVPLSADLSTRLINNAGSLAWFDERLSATPLQISKTDLSGKIRDAYWGAVKKGQVFQYQ